MITVYGIKNCDTMKKAFSWLNERDIEYRFHDYKKDGINLGLLNAWSEDFGWENLLNKRGTTWRQIPDEIKNHLDASSAIQLMLEKPSVIKRPILDDGNQRYLGFSPEQYQTIFEQ